VRSRPILSISADVLMHSGDPRSTRHDIAQPA
jgi:hypothetical protein